ncbi:sulfurtransferase [Synechococcus elongatus]|uniref:3-mercaptopyruvate sulfurtransferase n=1 Tax=Synechococcus elongatus (strain ATCC 33912 / PCC 7942 / FACHB-805) TaxID=1140 RepID=Q31KG2_SYNE7|nr:sulfurtransferase [Synechococcus elongatus]ABB58457.1 3-mercaptopyruvate sulfurtransferase [Synechococcus elongatus PCC 7942 = FACHB-805]AJD57082.1 3-mercaptopyruvate sulfurtransferase [Synechococcus elongatus UTEX 2973]MBD2587177.1 sulfurtransferase [Synechococcus elongatus FACHB-242]MBD2688248.1 sulfurtransferase [Synechococcus elongatus FACHB-1061]MBD2706041.1 sulfurtransferase [Synechococcus elongatus PCC 7942 = FACHB-805]
MSSPLVSAEWLQAHLHDNDLCLVDCRFNLMQPQQGRDQYQQGHLPGAVYLDLEQDLSAPKGDRGGRHPLPDIEALAARLGAIGISSDPATLVVAYDASFSAFASRLWWLLRYLGHERVAVLDGGLAAWQAIGGELVTDIPAIAPAKFQPHPQTGWVVDAVGLKVAQARGQVLIDSREADRYRGDREPIDPVAGHIPGAQLAVWKEALDEKGYWRLPSEQQQRWQHLSTAVQPIIYCGSGVTACVNLLSWELAGRSPAQLYAGSWSDWCSDPENAIATGEE